MIFVYIKFAPNDSFSVIQSRRLAGIYERRHEISNNVVCATNKASDQPAYMRSLMRAFAIRLIVSS